MSGSTSEGELFTAALALSGPARIAFLDRVCAGQPELRTSLESLLASSARADGDFLEGSPPPPGFVPGETVGARIDRYKLLEKLGEGGCGVVYLAEQELPVRRPVALKVIKLGMDTAAVIARFEAERQALALMDHPNIARVFDAGATATGRPYFVMELVHGTRITDYCNHHRLPTADRLALFTHVCHAIQHAHQKGVIHRDIKPSNILVSLHDGVPVPKVIDFGIAKATHGRLTDHTLFTAFEQFVGTPAYMSPEQAELSGVDVDTRSDIYSLGVLLYELLSGAPPFDPVTLRQAGLDEVRRIIRDVEPPRPSTRLATLADQDRATVARQRDTAPAQLTGLLRGDLDWIVMRCLEKNRARRYETPSALAADIARHLENEPVVARPPSGIDRTRKLVARHKAAFATAAIVAVLLVASSILSTWQYFRERAALARVVAAERTQLQLRLAAESNLARATAAEQTQLQLRLAAESNLARATVAEQTQARLAQQAERARVTEAGLRTEADAARANEARMRRAAEEGQTLAQTEAVRAAQVARLMSEMLRGVGPRVALGRDTRLLRDILDDTAKRIGPELAGQPAVEADLSATLAQAYADLGDLSRAVTLRRRVLALRQDFDPDDAVAVGVAYLELGRALLSQGNAGEAEAVFRTALSLQEKVGDGRARNTRDLLATALGRQGRHPEARATSGSVSSRSSDVGPIPVTAGSPLVVSTAPASAPASSSAVRRRERDTLQILSVSPANAIAGVPVKVIVRVAYRLASFPVGRVTLGFNTMAPTRSPIFDTKIIDGGEGELELSGTVTPVTHPNGARFSLVVSLNPEPRAPGAASLVSESRAIDPL